MGSSVLRGEATGRPYMAATYVVQAYGYSLDVTPPAQLRPGAQGDRVGGCWGRRLLLACSISLASFWGHRANTPEKG
jgi:hypothetical protein